MHEYSRKPPERGNIVVDENRLPPNRGEIISGIWDFSDTQEVFTDVFVRFSQARTAWYSVREIEDYWVSEINAYVLNAPPDGSNGE